MFRESKKKIVKYAVTMVGVLAISQAFATDNKTDLVKNLVGTNASAIALDKIAFNDIAGVHHVNSVGVNPVLGSGEAKVADATATADESVDDLSLNELFTIKVPEVFTASKSEQSLTNAPSVMTVIDEKEIKIKGYRSVEDALFRTVGFWPTRQFTWNGILGSRGLVQDKNSHYLFLTDGHSLNNIDDSHSHTYMFPTIEKVKAIEIVRGPGSTMWGSDAALGIINIITKNGGDINGWSVSQEISAFPSDIARKDSTGKVVSPFNYSTNIMYGKKVSEDVNAMFSCTYWNGTGWLSHNQFPWQDKYEATVPVQAYDNNWEMYGKVNTKDFTLKAGYSRGKDAMGWSSTANLDNRTSNTWQNFWIENEYNRKLAEGVTFNAKLFTDYMSNMFFIDKAKNDFPASSSGEYSNLPASDLGGEAIVSGTNFKNHQWKIGLRYVRTITGPSIGERVWVDSGVYHAGADASQLLMYNKDGIDNLTGLFVEDQWKVVEPLILIGGVRLDNNDLREKGSQILPRAGIIYKPLEYLSLKYLFNSGYLRPSQFQAANYRFNDVNKSEKIYSNDLQFLFQNKTTSVGVTPFVMFVENYITWVDAANVSLLANTGGNASGNYNVGNFTSKGVEVEAKQNIGSKVSVYGNYSYAKGKLGTNLSALGIVNKDGSWHGIPTQIFNLGVDVNPYSTLTCNLNARGWDGMTAKKNSAGWTDYFTIPSAAELDLTIAYNKIAGTPLSASVYMFNLLNNAIPIADANVGGPMLPKPRTISGKIGYVF